VTGLGLSFSCSYGKKPPNPEAINLWANERGRPFDEVLFTPENWN